jgi:hypothetical protein
MSFDIQTFSRSANTGIIKLPIGLTASSTGELVSEWLDGALSKTFQDFSLWHGLSNFPQFIECQFLVLQTGAVFNIYNGEEITVTDQNGWTAEFKFSPLTVIHWVFVDGSIRDANGNVPAPGEAEPTPGISIMPPSTGEPAAGITITYPNGPSIYVIPFLFSSNNLPNGVITVQPLDNDAPGLVSCVNLQTCPPVPD